MSDITKELFQKNQIEKKQQKLNEETKKINKRRRIIFAVATILMIISSMNMMSSAFEVSPEKIKKHIINIIIFYVIYLLIGNISKIKKFDLTYRILSDRRVNVMIYMGSMTILLGMVVGIKLGWINAINGAYGWIRLGGMSIQPAEILKVAFIINISNYLARAEDNNLDEKPMLIFSLVYFLSYTFLIVLQKDLGTVIHYTLIYLIMLFMTKLNLKYIIRGSVAVITLITLSFAGIYKYYNLLDGGGYKIKRIISFIDGLIFNNYSNDVGYQVKQSVYAFGNGGFLGRGYFNGFQKYYYLPEIHTDFIMATYGEEFGTIGISLVILLFLIMCFYYIKTGIECRNYFGKYLAIGLGAQIITQVFLNLFVIIGLFPVFGLPMPFFSYGGSAMLALAVNLGLIHNMNIKK